MNGMRFHLESQDTAKRRCDGSVVAALVCSGRYRSRHTLRCEALAAVFDRPNTPVASTGVAHDDWCRKRKRISEATARNIHAYSHTAR